jgi:uncharacterized protein (DUF169 family)
LLSACTPGIKKLKTRGKEMTTPEALSIFEKFNFEKPPVGMKFLFHKPEGMEHIDKKLAFCEMVGEAQRRGKPFYFTKDDETCFGTLALGMVEPPPFAESGQIGIKLEIFEEPRANARFYVGLPKMLRGTVNYVALSPLDKLTFSPDLLIITATASQAEIILRAMSYSTGEIWETKKTGVLGCAWAFVYPYQSGKVNYTVTGLSFGMKAHESFPEGWVLISIPYNWIPTITQNLKKMKWAPPAYAGREKFLQQKKDVMEELIRESENP